MKRKVYETRVSTRRWRDVSDSFRPGCLYISLQGGTAESPTYLFKTMSRGSGFSSSTVSHLSIGFENGCTSDVYWFRNIRYRHLLEVHSTTYWFWEETFLLLVEPLPSTNASPICSPVDILWLNERRRNSCLLRPGGRPHLAWQGRRQYFLWISFEDWWDDIPATALPAAQQRGDGSCVKLYIFFTRPPPFPPSRPGAEMLCEFYSCILRL